MIKLEIFENISHLPHSWIRMIAFTITRFLFKELKK